MALAGAACSQSKVNDEGSDVNEDAVAAEEVENVLAEETPQGDEAVVVLNDDTLYRPDSKVDRLTILDFNAVWCGPCKKFTPVFEQAAAKYGDSVDFVSVDTDVNGETAQAFGITSIPTVIFIYPDGTMKKYVGLDDLMPESKFNALVESEK